MEADRHHAVWVQNFVIVGTAVAFLAWLAPWQAVIVPDDEGFEGMKALLQLEGFRLYEEIWSDQPPLHTVLLSGAFQCFGVSVPTMRLIALVFAALTCWVLVDLAGRSHGALAGTVTVLCCLASPVFCRCAVSSTIMMPAYSLGLLAGWLAVRAARGNFRTLPALAGGVFAAAMLVKLIAVLLLPGALLGLLNTTTLDDDKLGDRIRRFTWWLAGAVGAIFALWLCFPAVGPGLLWSPHLSVAVREQFMNQSAGPFLVTMLGVDWPWLMLAASGVTLAFVRRRSAPFIVPLLLFLVAIVVHLWLRPFWSYYYLHFIIPLAWLVGMTVAEWIDWLAQVDRKAVVCLSGTFVIGCLVPALSALPERWQLTKQELDQKDAGQRESLLAFMREFAGPWILTDQPGLAFQAGLRVPPEAVVLSRKRLQLGLFSTRDFIRCIRTRQPGVIAWGSGWNFGSDAVELLQAEYEPHGLVAGVQVFRRKSSPPAVQ